MTEDILLALEICRDGSIWILEMAVRSKGMAFQHHAVMKHFAMQVIQFRYM